MSENSGFPKEIDQNGLASRRGEAFHSSFNAEAIKVNNEALISQSGFFLENSGKAGVFDPASEDKDKSRKNRSRSRSRHRRRESPLRGRREPRRSNSRSRDHRERRSRSKRRGSRSRSRDRRRKSRSPERKRYHSRSIDRKVEKKNGKRESPPASPARISNSRAHNADDAFRRRKRSRSRERSSRFKRSPEMKRSGNDAEKSRDDSSRYSYRRQNDGRCGADVKSPRENYRKNEARQSHGSGWQRDANQSNWNNGRLASGSSEGSIGKSMSSIRKEFETKDASRFPNDSSSSSIPVLLSSNCKDNDLSFPMVTQAQDGGFTKSDAPQAEGRLHAPPRLAVPPPTGFKDGLPNVREPPPAFLPFRSNNPVTVRLQAEPQHPPQTFTLLDHSRLPIRGMEPQQVLLQPLQVIRGPAKMEFPVDLRFLNHELQVPVYSTRVIDRSMAPSQQVANFVTGISMDQARMVQPRMVGVPRATDLPPPPPPPQTFAITQTQGMVPNVPFGVSGVSRVPENVSFLANPPPRLIFGSLGNQPGFITNLPMGESLQPRVPASHAPPPQMVIQDFRPQIMSSSTTAAAAPSDSSAPLPVHSTADVQSKPASAAKTNRSKPKNTGSERYSPFSCSSGGSSNDAYSDTLFEDPSNDTSTPLEEEEEEEENSTSHEAAKEPEHSVTSASHGVGSDRPDTPPRTTGEANPRPTSDPGGDSLRSLVGIPGIANNIDLSSTLDLIHVNDLKKVLETANSVTKVRQNETSEVKLSKAQRMEQIAEEVKVALKPHFSKNVISKEEYKDIMRKAVPKIFTSRSSPDTNRIQAFVQEYVNKIVKSRRSGKIKNTTAHGASHDKKQSSKIPTKA